MAQFKADRDMLTWRDSGRQIRPRQALIIHTDESYYNPATKGPRDTGWTADQLAQYNIDAPNDTNRGSYHLGIDRTGRVVRQNDDVYGTWSTGNQGNTTCYHVSLTGTATLSRAGWLKQTRQLDRLADVIAHYCREYGIPAVRLTPADLRAGRRGIAGHWDCTHAWSGGSGHWDPGGYQSPWPGTQGGFPWDVVISKVTERLAPKPAPTPKDGFLMALTDAEQHELLAKTREVWDQLRGPAGKGWPQLGQNEKGDNLTLIDAVGELRRHDSTGKEA